MPGRPLLELAGGSALSVQMAWLACTATLLGTAVSGCQGPILTKPVSTPPPVVIPPPVSGSADGAPREAGDPQAVASAVALLPTQSPAGPAPRADFSGRMLIASTRTSLRPRSDLAIDYRLAWLTRDGFKSIPLPRDDRGVVDATTGPASEEVVAIVGDSLLRIASGRVVDILPPLGPLSLRHPDSYLQVTWAGEDKLLVRQTAPAGLFYVSINGQHRQPISKAGLEPAVSPDGKRVALGYAEGKSFYSIYVGDTGFTHLSKLTGDSILEASAAWSPDGTQIAYAAQVRGTTAPLWEVRTAFPDGSHERTLVPARRDFSYSTLRWSPDGSQLAVTRYDEASRERQIAIVAVPGGEEIVVSGADANDRVLGWVP